MSYSRTERSRLLDWLISIDRSLLFCVALLVIVGCVLSLAASPAVAIKKGLPTFHFFERHMVFAALAGVIVVALSMLTPQQVRRVAVVLLTVAVAGMAWAVFFGEPLNGARRWLSILGYSLQPSELAKPAFVVVMAWLFAEAGTERDMPALPLAFVIWASMVGLLVMQPDVGQTMLISATAGAMYVLAGLPMIGAAILVALFGAGVLLAYQTFDHVRSRVDTFLNPAPFENYQVDRAIESFASGGLFGRGPGEGAIKSVLPDAHTDFIFAVVAEEYGVIVCLLLLAVYAFIVLRAFASAATEPNAADRLAVQGLATLFGLQVIINVGVNTGLLPPKGMTLPFISAGGSSMIAQAVSLGMLIALTRWRADPARLTRPRLVPLIEEGRSEEPVSRP